MVVNSGRNLFCQIDEILAFGGIYFGSWAAICHNDIHSKMADPEWARARLQ